MKHGVLFFVMLLSVAMLLNCGKGKVKKSKEDIIKVVGVEKTEWGSISTNKFGEYLIEDWEIYYKIFVKAVKNRDRELLKKLTHYDIIYDKVDMNGTIHSWDRDDWGKAGINRVDLDIVEDLIRTKGSYLEFKLESGRILKEYYFPKWDVKAPAYRIAFRNSGNGGGWEWEGLEWMDENGGKEWK